MASTSAPRVRSSVSSVLDCARPSPANAISTRRAACSLLSRPRSLGVGPSPPPVHGVAAVGPPGCRPRVCWAVS
eukprot:1054433-Pleurochrysis_carterae.AAC.1